MAGGGAAALIVFNFSFWPYADIVWAKPCAGKNVEFSRWNASRASKSTAMTMAGRVIVITPTQNTYIMNAIQALGGSEWQNALMAGTSGVVNALSRMAITQSSPRRRAWKCCDGREWQPQCHRIEINSIIANTIMRNRYANYAYHLYEAP